MHLGRLLVGLGRPAPHHDEPVAVVLDAEALDVVDQRLGQVQLVVAGLHPGAVEPLHPALVEHGVHGDDALELAPRSARGRAPRARRAVRAASSAFGRDRVPAAEDEVVEDGERDEVLDQRVAALAAARRGGCGPSG